ncbi:MAG: glutamate formimidoyltransferase [Firmicutes bacterium]|nr:glutamate formimidoyltransferase [Bacillota bacterium]
MEARIVECVPNFSEGRRKEVIEAIAGQVRAVEGVRLLDYTSDVNHNRTVMTFVGAPRAVKEAAFTAIAKAAALINMEEHRGEHPRIGATDVVPFVPVMNVSMEECVALARELGKEVAERLDIPVYLYEAAATRPERRNLADIRRGQYEGLKAEIGKDPARDPDFGPARLHPAAGATVIGARPPLVAFNVNLGTPDVRIAREIARRVRAKNGGLANVKALGVMLEDRRMAQVSMNLVNYRETAVYRAFELVKMEAACYGVPVVGSEIVGLVPMDALLDGAEYYLRLEGFDRRQILERRLAE